MSEYETLGYEVSEGILTLWLDRPENLNAFTVTMANELEAAYDRASADDDVAAIVVTGTRSRLLRGHGPVGRGQRVRPRRDADTRRWPT